MQADGSGVSYMFDDWVYPDGWGQRDKTDPPHYFWLMVVDPRGALILGGGGEHGLTRIRKQRPDDSLIANDGEAIRYENAKLTFRFGCGGSDAQGRPYPAPMLELGSEAHSFLGIKDATDYKTASDAEIIAAFNLTNNNCPDDKRADMAWFIRKNAWLTTGAVEPNPPVDAVCHWELGVETGWIPVVGSNPPQEHRIRTDVYTLDSPAQNGGADCTPAPGTTRTVIVEGPRPVPPPPPADPCILTPLNVTVGGWPSLPTGNRSLTWNSRQQQIASFVLTWTPSLRVTFTDTRGCSVTRIK
jgi:hypothetical protein